jgi:hypothetical protein
MSDEYEDLRKDISVVLSSLRFSMERPLQHRLTRERPGHKQIIAGLLVVEEARILFNSYTRYRPPLVSEWGSIRTELMSVIQKLLNSKEVDPGVYRFRFMYAPGRDREKRGSPLLEQIANCETVLDALLKFHSFLENLKVNVGPSQRALTFDDLNRIVPRQQLAPVQFDIADGKIVVARRPPKLAPGDQVSVSAALEHIKGSGEQLIENLAKSNCDRRLIDSVKELQTQIINNANVIKVGMTNLSCGIMCAQFRSELPDAISAMFYAYNSSISLYVAQFPEWEEFTQKAAAIELAEDDVREVNATAQELISSLNRNPQLAEPQVPKTLEFVRQFLLYPGPSAKRAAFAMVRTIENLVASILHYVVKFSQRTAEKTAEIGSTVTATAIGAFLGVALAGALGISSAASSAGAPWVRQVTEIIQKEVDKLN